jgi:hypothetical protein
VIYLQHSKNARDEKIGSSALLLPADGTSASRTDDLGLGGDTERDADELCREIDRGAGRAAQQLERYYIYDPDDTILSHSRVLKHTLRSFLGLWW